MINKDSIVTEHCTHAIHRICWSAIFAGALVGLGLGFLLHLYGTAISLSAYSASDNGASTVAIGGFLGMLLGVIVSMGATGFVAGYLGRFHYHPLHGGVVYGFITWSLVMFLSVLMIGPMGDYISAYEKTLAHTTVVTAPDADKSKTTASRGTTDIKRGEVKTADKAPVIVSPKELAWAGWLMFLLFFVGAISSCLGACFGMQCKKEERVDYPHHLK